MVSKNTICLWYDGTALDAAQFYAATFPDSKVGAVHRAPADYPAGRQAACRVHRKQPFKVRPRTPLK